jgi:cyanophycinase
MVSDNCMIMPPGPISLAGGGEFGGTMAAPDRRLIELAGGAQASIAIIPAAAAPDNNHRRAGSNGVRWFESLGARQVQSLPLIDPVSAADPDVVSALRQARLIYLLGGFPGHLHRSLAGSPAWQAILDAHRQGAAIAGSSAGAMVLCAHFFDPYENQLSDGLSLIPNTCVLPHFTRFGKSWAPRLLSALPGVTLLGIDEGAAVISPSAGSAWTVYGAGAATIYRQGSVARRAVGESFTL